MAMIGGVLWFASLIPALVLQTTALVGLGAGFYFISVLLFWRFFAGARRS